ncbi:MAG TPA: electron transfer flavoprotein subunit beta/FixA family protein [Candidatus Stackebrandtia faecavium]|nr:electron transfer flavoprotein subunit beta/FixA family protein [Candidatus Stackebrandtia faecavium]
MDILVCVKRVPGTGSSIPLTPDNLNVDTKHLGFTVGPHEECAIEEAVQIATRTGGTATVLTVGPQQAEEQLRYAMSMGMHDGVLVDSGEEEWDPQATAAAIVEAIGALSLTFDLVLFGNETPDAGNYQVGVRVACALGLPLVGGIKGIEFDDEQRSARFRRDVAAGIEVYEAALPAAAAVKEGLNLPRYPTIRGRLHAKKAQLRTFTPTHRSGGLTKVRLHQPPPQANETVFLGEGEQAAAAVVDVFEELEVM